METVNNRQGMALVSSSLCGYDDSSFRGHGLYPFSTQCVLRGASCSFTA
jgi:hypothetical protein